MPISNLISISVQLAQYICSKTINTVCRHHRLLCKGVHNQLQVRVPRCVLVSGEVSANSYTQEASDHEHWKNDFFLQQGVKSHAHPGTDLALSITMFCLFYISKGIKHLNFPIVSETLRATRLTKNTQEEPSYQSSCQVLQGQHRHENTN